MPAAGSRQRTRRMMPAVVALLTVGAAAGAVWAAAPAQAGAGCQVTYQANSWTGGFTANLTVSVGSTAVSSWTLTWSYPGGQQVTNAWSATVSQSGTQVTATNAAYNGTVPVGGSVQFGLQGTYPTANPDPTDFALNGTPCNGAGATPSASASPTSGPGPSASPSASTGPSPSSGGATGCGTAAFCDGFEGQATGTPSGAWSVTYPNCSGAGTATVDGTVAHGGGKSLRIDGAATYCNHVFVTANTSMAAIGPVWYGRFYVRHTTTLPVDHVTFLAMADANDGNNDLRMGGQNSALQWNRQSDDATLPAQSPAGVAMSMPLPTGQWSCVEFMVDGTAGTMDTWLNGTMVAGLHEDGVPTQDVDQQWLSKANWHPSLADFRLGWEAYGNGADTLWFDDVALGSARVGC